jgi:hypothetical protein
MLLLTGTDQVGVMFFNRLVEDRVVAVLLLLPIFALVVTSYLKQPTNNRAFLAVLVGAALVLTHPTITGLAIGVIGLYAGMDFFARRNRRATLVVLGILALMLAVLLGLRALQPAYASKIVFGVDEELLRGGQLRRIVHWGQSLYAVPFKIVTEIPYAWTVLATLLAMMQLKTSFAARWLVSAMLILASVLVPFTAPLWSLAVPAAQLWRVAWIAPFGIAAAYLVARVGNRLAPRMRPRVNWSAVALVSAMALILLGAAYGELAARGNLKSLHTIRLPKHAQGNYADLIALRPALDARLQQPAVVVGGDKWLNEHLPGVTANVRVISFRSTRNMWQLGNQTLEQAKARTHAFRRLTGKKADTATRLEILKRYNARWLVAEAGTEWVEKILENDPVRLTRVSQHGTLSLYEIRH